MTDQRTPMPTPVQTSLFTSDSPSTSVETQDAPIAAKRTPVILRSSEALTEAPGTAEQDRRSYASLSDYIAGTY